MISNFGQAFYCKTIKVHYRSFDRYFEGFLMRAMCIHSRFFLLKKDERDYNNEFCKIWAAHILEQLKPWQDLVFWKLMSKTGQIFNFRLWVIRTRWPMFILLLQQGISAACRHQEIHNCSVTRIASAQHWGDNGFKSRHS